MKRQESKPKGVSHGKGINKPVEVQAKVGAPTKYDPSYPKQAKKLCLLGATNPDLAKFFEVSTSTIDLWIATHAAFSGAIKGGREEADAKVAKSLYQRAMGYEHDEEVIMQYQGTPIRVKTRKKYPPDTASMIFWLKNRDKARWRDRIEHTGADGKDLPIPVIQVLPRSE